jgi:type VI secretion system secreted protein VgrG
MSVSGEHPIEARLEASDFPCDDLQISRVTGREAISQLYRFEIFVTCRDPAGLDPQKVTGATATLVFARDGEDERRISGMIAEMTDLLDSETQFYTYRLVLVPRAHVATLVHKQEIFVDAGVPDALKITLDRLGLAKAHAFRLVGEYPQREFIVQYKETDLAFLSRLTEHLGISFFVEQHERGDVLVITDHAGGFLPLQGDDHLPFRPRGEHRSVFRLDATTRLIPGSYVVSDYDYEKPNVPLEATFKIENAFGGGVIEYGANFKEPKEGAALA